MTVLYSPSWIINAEHRTSELIWEGIIILLSVSRLQKCISDRTDTDSIDVTFHADAAWLVNHLPLEALHITIVTIITLVSSFTWRRERMWADLIKYAVPLQDVNKVCLTVSLNLLVEHCESENLWKCKVQYQRVLTYLRNKTLKAVAVAWSPHTLEMIFYSPPPPFTF